MSRIRVSKGKVTAFLAVVVTAISVAGAIEMFVKLHLDRTFFMHFFDLAMESNLPTWYSSMSLLICSALLFIIAHSRKRSNKWQNYWYGLSVMFVLLSLDEMGKIHERAGIALGIVFPDIGAMGGVMFYSWTLLGGIAVLTVSAIYIRFFINLPRFTRLLFFLAAASFVGGALGLEMVNSWIADSQGSDTFSYVALTVVEETLEMVGVLVFIFALLEYIEKFVSKVELNFR